MATRKIVKIDEDKCDGCGDCVLACDEGALKVIDGKAKLVGDILCDGFGACLGECPQGALTIEEREADAYDEEAVRRHLAAMNQPAPTPVSNPMPSPGPHGGGCPGSAMRQFNSPAAETAAPATAATSGIQPAYPSLLGHWPIQLMLVPPGAPFLKGADLLICADCVPFTVPDFHARYLQGRAVLVGCPKLDDLNFYLEKLHAIFQHAQPSRITVLRMEVPCCGGIADAALQARDATAPHVPTEVHTIGVRGGIHCEQLETRTA